jgi:hypothetical protein
MSDLQPDFNWVLERSKCSLSVEFAMLQKEADENVKCRNSLLGAQHRFGLECRPDGKRTFLVRRWDTTNIEDDVIAIFTIQRDGIVVDDGNRNHLFTLIVTLNDMGDCRFQIDGMGEFKRWQVLKRALEKVLFS